MKQRDVLVIAAIFVAGIAFLVGRSSAPSQRDGMSIEVTSGHDLRSAVEPVNPPSEKSVKPAVLAPKRGDPLPPSNAPLRDTFAGLQARANAGDAAAASRLFRDVNRCSRLRGSEWKNSGASDDLTSKKTEGMTPEQLRTYQILLDAMELRQQGVRESQNFCDDASQAMLDSLVPNIAQAARLGDEDARACYLGRGPLYDSRSLIDHPDALQTYRSDAKSMIDAGLAAGDWRVVDLLQQAYEPGAQGLLAGVVGTDPVQHYRYLKLYRLGAEQHRVAQLDRQIAAAAANLTPAQVAEADEWAQSNLQNFRGPSTAGTPQGWEACAFAGN
ncbi:hypothetical protein [Dokdonella sp.]|uniref:hypothetical protein n=1 Tax=Dokdonella sp. TaxID=2291710 RepID=UPI001B29C209|nr:hypothetical protein [Dokdonella sp.]MBO9663747.1 hypothetical protein [Dokdonella sp.]